MATTMFCDSVAALLKVTVHVFRTRNCGLWILLISLLMQIGDRGTVSAEETSAFSAVRSQCYRDRSHATAIAQAEDRLRASAAADGVSLLQWVLDQPFDGFIETKSGVISAKSRAEQLLRSVPQPQYQLQFGAGAEVLFAKAKIKEADLSIVLQRFFLTESGFAAAELLIANWLDRGEYDLAAVLLERVSREPRHAARITANLRRISETIRLEGNIIVPFLADSQRESTNQQAGQKSTTANHLLGLGWMVCGGDQCRNRVITGSMPLLQSSWIVPAQSSRRQHDIESLLKNLEGRQRDLDRPVCAASFPIVIRDKIILRDMNELRAINTSNGQTVWSFECESSVAKWSERNGAGRIQSGMGFKAASPMPTVDSWFENSREGMLSSDGRFVYAVVGLPEATEQEEEAAAQADVSINGMNAATRNKLIALLVDQPEPDNCQAAWTNDGLMPQRPGLSQKRAIFLGPPLPSTTELLCVTEQQNEIHLTSLDPASGELLWTQPVCVLDRAAANDTERQRMACVLARSNGIAVFPTNTGLMVAVDLVRRRLLWVSFVDDLPEIQLQRSRESYRAPTLGYAGYASHVVVASGRVVYLPPRSGRVHCLDLMTGKSVWTSPRRDGEFVANIVEGRALVVGRQHCRCLSLVDGSELWSSPIDQPAGRGLCLGNRYILPVDDGRLASLDMATGRDMGSSIPHSDVPLGHLIADGSYVYSLSHRKLIAFPQAHKAKAELDGPMAKHRTEAEREVVLAEVDLAEGRMADAERRLRIALTGVLPDSRRIQASRDLKLLLMARLNGSDANSLAEWDLLERLIETPTERFQFLASRFHQLPEEGRDRLPVELVEGIYRLPSDLMYSPSEDAKWSMSPAVWNRLLNLKPSRDELILQQQRDWFEIVFKMDDPAEQRRFVRAFDDDAMARPVRARLATKLAMNGEPQAAETLWLRNRMSNDPATAAEAAASLSELWERAGFLDEAAEQLDSLATKFAGVKMPNGLTGAEYIAHLSPNQSARQVWQRSQRLAWNVDRVEIVESPADLNFVQQPGFDRESPGDLERFVPERAGSFSRQVSKSSEQPCEFVFTTTERGAGAQQVVTVFDRRTSLPRGVVRVPTSHRWPTAGALPSAGHLIPLGLSGGLIGLSTMQLTDGEPVWKQLPASLKDRQSVTFPGPSGPSFASFLWRNRLYVVDPLDGELLWQRTLSINSQEIPANQRMEVIGDHLALAVQSPDRATYEVFETSTGRALKTVRSGFDSRQWQASFGRHIAGIVDTPEGRRLQILDLLKEAPNVSEPVGDRVLIYPIGQGEFAFLGTNGEIKVFDTLLGERKLNASLDISELVGFGAFRVMADYDRYYVNLQRQIPTAMTANYNQALIDSPLPGVHLRDDIYAFDRASGRLLWMRSIPYRTVLQFPRCHVPFLVAVSVVKDRQNANQQSLTVEVLSGLTGETIGYRENLPFDRLLFADYDATRGRIILTGQLTNIDLRFDPGVQTRQLDSYAPNDFSLLDHRAGGG